MMAARKHPAANAVDRAIAYVAPGWAARRLRSRAFLAMTGAYDGARSDNAGGRLWFASGGSADQDLQPDLDKLRQRSRDLQRNNPLARGALQTARISVVGPGLMPLPSIDADYLGLDDEAATAFERQVQREWQLFADNIECDMTRKERFPTLQGLLYQSVKENGDAFAFLRMRARPGSPYALKIQLIEADQVCDPPRNHPDRDRDATITGGVEHDAEGAPIAVWLANRHPGAFVPYHFERRTTWTRVPVFGRTGRRAVLHIMRRNRIGQSRGEPWLAPVIETIKQIGRYTQAEIMAAVVNACFAITTQTGDQAGMALPELTGHDDAKGDAINLAEPGMVVDLGTNETVESFTPGRPNSAFDPFMMSMMRHVGAALGIPVELLVKHFTASYSASRAALLEAWRFYRDERAWLVGDFCRPIYETFLAEAVLMGRLVAPGFLNDPLAMRAWSGCEWIGPAPGHIQPKQEAEAAALRIGEGITTLAEEIGAYSAGSWENKHRQRVKEAAARRRDGLSPAAAPAVAAAPAALPAPDDPDDDEEDSEQ